MMIATEAVAFEAETGRPTHAWLWEEPVRRRLVRLCAAVSGDRGAAEDLAQETLLEAWRNLHKLHEPAGADRWLAAIARNVCLRWARRQGRELGLLAAVEAKPRPEDSFDVELELERAELAELLDRALALVPPDTRDVLIHRYVHDLPHAEIAGLLDVSEDAVSMRLSRGKVVLRRVLAGELREEASAHGVAGAPSEQWRETRVWCTRCGQRRLVVRREPPPGAVSFRCPGCNPDASALASQFLLANPFFAGLVSDVVRPTAILRRMADWTRRYFTAGAGPSGVGCTRCGGDVPLRHYVRVGLTGGEREGMYAECESCGEVVSTSLAGIALALPEVQRFRRDHPRIRALPALDVELHGLPAVVVRYADRLGSTEVGVVFARSSHAVLEVRGLTS